MTTSPNPPDRVLLLALGTDVLDRAVHLIACRAGEAGHDVVVGTREEMRSLVDGIAPHERVVVGLSVARGGGGELVVALELLRASRGVVRLFAGGEIDADQAAGLARQHGVHVFPRDVTTREIVAWLENDDRTQPEHS